MIDANKMRFQERVAKIREEHRRTGRLQIPGPGVDIILTKEPEVQRKRIVLRPILIFLVGVFALKALIFSRLGEDAYIQRLVELKEGSQGDQIAALLMAPDIITVTLADTIPGILSFFA